MKKLLSTLLVACTLATSALAQGTGQLPAGGIWGNPTASKAPATATTVFDTLNQVSGCTTQNNIIVRGASAWSCVATGSGVVTWLGTPSSANLAAAVTGETGSGALVFGTSPTIASAALSSPTITTLFTATGLVKYADFATAAIASTSEYYSGAASKIVPSSVIYPSETTTTFGATTTFDFSTFINTSVTLTANITTQTLSNVVAGKAGSIRFIQSGAGSFTTVWNSIFKFPSGVTPTLTTGSATAIDVLNYNCITTTYCQASLAKDVR